MKVSILSLTICPATQTIVEHFKTMGYEIDSVIIENNFRKKYSKREIEYRKKHDRFNRLTKKYSFIRRLAKKNWDMLPIFVRKFIQKKIYYIPLLNRFSIKKICENRNIKAFEVLKHSSEDTKKIIQDREINYLLMVSSNWLLKDPIISMKHTKIINAHSGLLPKHKGLDSIPWSIKENDKVGLTTHFIDSRIDSGPILRFYEARIEKGDNFNMIKKKVGSLQPMAFLDTLKGIEKDEIKSTTQNDKYKPHKPMSFDELLNIEKGLTA